MKDMNTLVNTQEIWKNLLLLIAISTFKEETGSPMVVNYYLKACGESQKAFMSVFKEPFISNSRELYFQTMLKTVQDLIGRLKKFQTSWSK